MKSKSAWIVLLAIALFPRGLVMWMQRHQLRQDPDGYQQIATCLANDGVFGRLIRGESRPTAFRPPLYPVSLAALRKTIGLNPTTIGLFHLLLGLATIAVTFLLARQALPGARYGPLVAAGLVAVDPILLQQSTLVMTETLATFLIVTVLFLLTQNALPSESLSDRLLPTQTRPGRPLSLGIFFGLACLCRPPFLAFAALVGATITLQIVRGKAKTQRTYLVAAGALLAVLAVWAVRNQVVLGRPLLTTTHGGYTVLLGNNQRFYSYLRESDWFQVWDSADLDRQSLEIFRKHDFDELPADREHYQLAYEAITKQPDMFAWSSLIRMQRLWGVFPYELGRGGSTARRLLLLLIGVWYIFVFVSALVGLWSIRDRWHHSPWFWGILLCLTLTLIHSLYWSNMRMRAPLTPFIALLAATGLRRLSAARNDLSPP